MHITDQGQYDVPFVVIIPGGSTYEEAEGDIQSQTGTTKRGNKEKNTGSQERDGTGRTQKVETTERTEETSVQNIEQDGNKEQGEEEVMITFR